MMFLKIMIATDEKPSDLESLLDYLNDRVDPSTSDITIVMVWLATLWNQHQHSKMFILR